MSLIVSPKTVFAPHLGKNVKLGRKRSVASCPHLKLRNYLRKSTPTPPGSADYTAKSATALGNVYMNDTLGCCVIAGGYHVVGVETGNAGDLFVATDNQIVTDYGAIGGYNGTPGTDNGCDLQTAMNYWVSKGFANGTKLVGWLAVDASNEEEIQTACYLFENLYMGMELADLWINPMPSAANFVWDAAGDPDPENGHCIMGAGYDGQGVIVDTWGLLGKLTYAALKKYATQAAGGELYVLLSPDQLARGQTKAPNGIAWTDLISDFEDMGGQVNTTAGGLAIPTIAPAPAPAPGAPPPLVTLAEAQGWLQTAFKNGPLLMTRGHAEAFVADALAKAWPK